MSCLAANLSDTLVRTMEAACDLFLDHLRAERNLSRNTIEAYAHDLRELRAALAAQGVRHPEQVRAVHLSRWQRRLALRGLAVASQARALTVARRLFAFLVREGQLDANPLRDVVGPKLRRHLPTVLSEDEARGLIEIESESENKIERKIESELELEIELEIKKRGGQADATGAPNEIAQAVVLRDRAIFELLYAAGLRASELCHLRKDDLRLNGGTVRVRGKGSKERLVPLGQPAVAALRRYLDEGREVLLRGRDDDRVFFGTRGGPFGRSNLFHVVRRRGLRAGIARPISPHTIRHAFATHLLRGGADLRVVQELLGHANVTTTEIYTHLAATQLRDAVERHHPLGDGARRASVPPDAPPSQPPASSQPPSQPPASSQPQPPSRGARRPAAPATRG